MAKNTTTTADKTTEVQAINPLVEAEAKISSFAKLESENLRLRASLAILDANKIRSDVASLRGDIKARYGVSEGTVNRASLDKSKSVLTERSQSDVSELPEKAKKALAYANKVLNAFTTLTELVNPDKWKANTSH